MSQQTSPSTPAETPEEIRARIENTRQELSTDVNTLAETVRPGNVARRQVDKAKDAAGSARDRVMGSAGTAKEKVMGTATNAGRSTSSTLSDAASSSQQAVAGAPGAVKARTEGNPLAAGLIAFGAGMLLGSLLPATRQEEKAVTKLKENASTVTGPVTDVAREVGENLRGSAQEAAGSVRSTATDAAQTVKEEATSAGQQVKDQGVRAQEQVRETRS